MLVIQSLPWVIVLMIIGMVLLGAWPALWNRVERHGRIPSHTFLDYTIGYLVVAVATSVTLGTIGPPYDGMPNFFEQLRQPNGAMVGFAAAGGVCLALGDIAMQYAVALLGLSAGPAILNAMTIIIGTILSYFLDGGINKGYLVFPGLAMAAVAIGLGAISHLINPAMKKQSLQEPLLKQHQIQHLQADKEQQQQRGCLYSLEQAELGLEGYQGPQQQQQQSAAPQGCADRPGTRPHQAIHQTVARPAHSPEEADSDCLHPPQPSALKGIEVTTAAPGPETREQQEGDQQHTPKQRSIGKADTSIYLGLAIAVAGGTIYALFLPAFQIAANDVFHLLPPDVPPLSIYATNFYFSLAFTVTSWILNIYFLYRPPLGTQSSTFKSYLSDHTGRGWSLLSGVLASCGDLSQFMGGQVAGYAAAMLVMAYPIVGVLWGMLHFREYKGSSRSSLVLLSGQVVCYAAAVGLMASSATLRTEPHR